jgi:hypothetical protein
MFLSLIPIAMLFAASADRTVDFDRDVRPIFQTRCYGCHGPQLQTSGLRLDDGAAAMAGGNSGPAIVSGHADKSKLILRVSGAPGIGAMPPMGKRLTAEEVATLRAWIDQGAKWPQTEQTTAAKPRSTHWAFQTVSKPAPPDVKNRAWVRNPIDNFILARLEKQKIATSQEADKRTLLRRVSLDLTGLPPTPEESASFVNDPRADAYEHQVDRLLASPHFGEKWARHWLDQARYADSDGYEKDWFRPWAWRWRQWVIDAINHDMPFDEFTIEQIAGDLLPDATVEQKVATGFHRNTLTNREGGVDDAQFKFEDTLDRANTIGTVWLGLSVGCAQCHNHKYDPIPQKDTYQLFAFFDNVEEVNIDAPLPGETGAWMRTRAEYEAKRKALLEEYDVPELQAAWEKDLLFTIANPGKRTDWDLAWDCVLKLTEGGDGGKIVQTPSEKRTQRDQDILTDHFVRNYHFAVGQKKYNELKFKELDQKLTALKEQYPQLSQAMVIEESPKPHPTFLRVRGDYKTPGIEVHPDTLSVLPPLGVQGRPANRLDLARWLVRRDNPLTSRVAVNRLWQEIFGQGIAKSSDDFGTRGEKPSHPELLDWLASEFMDRGWSRKEMIRLMVTSATYRQSSDARPELKDIDPDNRLLARQSRLRLPAELIRDSALEASGLLDPEIGGKSVRPPQPAGVLELGYAGRSGARWVESTGPEKYRRGLYVEYLRTTPYPQLANFDAPKASMTTCTRERSNSPLQALNLLNDPVFLEAAQALAVQTVSEPGDFGSRLQRVYERVVARDPDAKEKAKLEAYYTKQQRLLADDLTAQQKLAPYEPPGATRLETAAWTGVASVLLNLDEFITRE